MPENIDSDWENFGETTYREFVTLKNWGTARNMEKKLIENNRDNTLWGCLNFPFLIFGVWLGEKAFMHQSQKYNYPENEKRAKELLNLAEIRQALCSALYEVGSKDILTEEKMIKTIVHALGKEEVRDRFLIPFDAILFAHLSYELLQIGLGNYCRANDKSM